MTDTHHEFDTQSDRDLLATLAALAADERQATARVIGALAEVDARRLYLGEGCSSMFTYCTQVLHLSEHAAYARIEAARAARAWPMILELIADGSLHLTAITLLGRHLTAENHQALLAAARHKTKREIEAIVAALRPQPAMPPTVRKLPAPRKSSATRGTRDTLLAAALPVPVARLDQNVDRRCAPAPPTRPTTIAPLAPDRYKIQFTVSRATHDTLRRVQDLMRHRLPDGDVATIVDRALTLLLAELQKTKHACVARPRAPVRAARGRHVPAAVKRVVWARDGGQCAFVGARGRCSERGFLEYHHLVPYADGGATDAANLKLRCRAHNAYEAERWFGPAGPNAVGEMSQPYRLERREAT
jgi:5-methylcytosine-specific restriction endonuclease McrA